MRYGGDVTRRNELKYYPEVQDVAAWTRLREMVLKEAISPHWGSELHRLAHFGKVFPDELLAAERYEIEMRRWKRSQDLDPADYIGDDLHDAVMENRELIAEIRRRVPSIWRDRLDDLVLRNMAIVAKDLDKARKAMILLKTLFSFENKTRTKNR